MQIKNYYDAIIICFILLTGISVLLSIYNNFCDNCIMDPIDIGNIFKPKKILEYMKPVFGGEECSGILTNEGCIINKPINEVKQKTTGLFTDISYYNNTRAY
tara:strand:+ start:181 stop:486 length:306 start_codon:yes stop_codon:yes gene_type:complete